MKVWSGVRGAHFIKNASKTQQTMESHCEPVVNSKAYSRDPTTSLCTELRFRVYTPTNRKTGEPVASAASGPAVFTEQGIECWWGKWQSHWSLRVSYAEAQVNSASTVPNSQRECSLESLMETSRNLHRKFWTQRRMCSPGSSTCERC